MGLIYKVTSPNNKVYIGQTRQTLPKRKICHLCNAKNPKNENYGSKFPKAIRKWGKWLHWEALYNNVPNDRLHDLERWSIANHDSYTHGYNSTEGGDIPPMLGKHHTKETRLKISLKNKGCISNRKGIQLSNVTKQKIAKAKCGQTATQETRRKMSKAHSGERHWRASLSWEKVRDIRKRYRLGEKQKDLAIEFQVHKTTISDVIREKNWKI